MTMVATNPCAMSERYRRSVSSRLVLIAGLAVALCLGALADLAIGSGTLSPMQVITAVLHPASADPTNAAIIWQVRAPMTALALVAGAALALSGVLMQSTLNNPLADPFTLGVSAAAGFGASLTMVFGLSFLSFLGGWIPAELDTAANAFIASLITVGLVALISSRVGTSVEMVTLVGIAVHFTFSALLAFVQYAADPNQLQALIFWMLGSLLRATWLKVWISLAILAVTAPFLFSQAWALTTLRAFGDHAETLGVRVRRLRFLAMVVAALLAGAATSTIGVVGFIGLVAPHIARLMVGEDQRFALPATALCGALILTLASLASKLILPGTVLPIGMVTALLGIPFFLAQIAHSGRRRKNA